MEELWWNLHRNISSFFCLSARDKFGSESVQKCYIKIEELLKLLKPIADLILDSSIVSNEQLSKVLAQLVHSIEECSLLFEKWHPLASRIYLVVQAELLAKSIQTSILEVVQLLKDLPPFISAELIPKCLEHCFEKVRNIECESTCTFISEALKKQASSHGLQRTEIAERLGLRSNQDILIEAVALEKLKENAEQSGNDAEMDYLEELITLFTHMHDHLFMLVQSKIGMPDPTSYICPLSLEIMRDPVLVSSGITYEHAYIRHWLDLGLTVCPKTRQTLVHINLIPNYTSKALIAYWCEKNNVTLPDPRKSVNGQNMDNLRDIVDLDAEVKKLVEDLKSKSNKSLREATDQLLLFLKQKMDNRIIITYFGGIRLAVNLLYSNDPKIQENAVTALLYLAINNGNKVAITDEDAIKPLIYVLQVGTPKACENSAATLFCLSMIDENKLRIGRLGAIVPLVELLWKGTPQGKNNAVIALFNLSISCENRARIVQAGGVRFLIELVAVPTTGMADKAVAVLANLAKVCEGRTAIGQAGGIRALVNTLELGSTTAKGRAASALLQLCIFSSRYYATMIQEAGVPPLVSLSLSEAGNPRAKEKARALLSYIRTHRCHASEVCSIASDINDSDS